MRVAVSWVRDEADIIAATVGAMAEQVDAIIVMDHGSRDGTREILDGLSGKLPLIVLNDPNPRFHQAEAMNRLAGIAAENLHAEWIVPFDADEVWDLPDDDPDADVVRFAVFDHLIVDGVEGMPYRRAESFSTKVMFRPERRRELVMGNHSVSHPGRSIEADGIVHHFSIRSVEQFERKVRRGVATYRPGDYGAHWSRMAAQIDQDGVERVFRALTAENPCGLVYDPISQA